MITNATRTLSRRRLLAGSAALTAAAVAPGRGSAQEARKGGVLNYASLGLDTSDPHRHTGSIGVQQVYVETLTSIGANGSVEPFLARTFDISEEGRIYRFGIRDGISFHNGDPLTAADVAANIERVRANVKGGWLATAMKL